MKQVWNKIALLIIPVFFVATIVSMPGYAWCFGDDGHVDLKYVAQSANADDSFLSNSADEHEGYSLAQSDADHCGPCLDFYVELNDATTTKRLENKIPVSIGVVTLNSFASHFARNVKMVVGNFVPQPPRIAQSILNHRTVVRLN
jgi:hypothetical protein